MLPRSLPPPTWRNAPDSHCEALGDADVSAIAEKIAGGQVGGRLWFYSNYHCNLRCTYCLTDSAPGVSRRELGRDGIVRRAMQAADLGFTGFGVTGGEPFLLDYMPELLAALGSELPTVVLSNGTTFNRRRLEEMEPLADLPVHVQISLDRPDPDQNDEMRGPANFRKVVEAVPKLVERGVKVRISTTIEDPDSVDLEEMARLCELHRSLGVVEEDHIVRPVVARGRALSNHMGVPVGADQLEPELTLTADGAFFSPVGPTVTGGRLDADLMVSRTTEPVRDPAETLARMVDGRPAGDDASIGIR